MAARKMSNFNTNSVRLEAHSGDSSGPGRVVTVNLPEGSLLDMKSLAFHLDVATTGGTNIFARLPPGYSLIQRVEVYCNGVQLQGGNSDYGTMCKVLNTTQHSRDLEVSNAALSHDNVVALANENESASLVLSDFRGFLGESSARYLPTSLLGNIQIRFTMAGNEVLAPRENAAAWSANITTAALRTDAQKIAYSCSNIHFTIDVMSVDESYEQMLRMRLNEAPIEFLYKEYYSFTQGGISGSSASSRFSLSSGSIDAVYATLRESNYQTVGVRGHQISPGSYTPNLVPNYLLLQSFNGTTTGKGTLLYSFQINNVQHPQFKASVMHGMQALKHIADKVHPCSTGNLITSLSQYNQGNFVAPCMLSFPGSRLEARTGYDSRGVNSSMSWDVSGLSIPSSDTAAQTEGVATSTVFVETTAVLSVGLGKSVSVSW